jgi:hypothetical protein
MAQHPLEETLYPPFAASQRDLSLRRLKRNNNRLVSEAQGGIQGWSGSIVPDRILGPGSPMLRRI